jgi:hypothetical protein
MGVVALVVWLATAGAGLYLLAVWLIEYDREFQTSAATRLPVPVIGTHAVLALAGLGVWSAYLLVNRDWLAWTSVGILGAVAGLGFTMAARWFVVYRATGGKLFAARTREPLVPAAAGRDWDERPRDGYGPDGQGPPEPPPALVPPERNFPVPVVVTHGLFAATTIVLVLITALRS